MKEMVAFAGDNSPAITALRFEPVSDIGEIDPDFYADHSVHIEAARQLAKQRGFSLNDSITRAFHAAPTRFCSEEFCITRRERSSRAIAFRQGD
jgi:hypothetical protein